MITLNPTRKPTKEEIKQGKRLFLDALKDVAQEFTGLCEINKHHENAMDILEKSLEKAGNHRVMTPEVKRIIETFLYLVRYRCPLFNYEIEAIFRPVIEQTEKEIKAEFGRTGGKSPKKPEQKSRALTCWNEWARAGNPRKKHRNKTAFVKHLEELGLCNTKTGSGWVDEFREQYPAPALENILPPKKNR